MTTPPATPLTDAALRQVVDLVREQHTGPLGVDDLADQAGYSPFHFSRLFKASMGVPPGQYLIAHRIDTAKRLLLAGDESVVDVATAVGFDSLSSFSRRFRQTVGLPPAALRRLADEVADAPVRPFRIGPPDPADGQAVEVCHDLSPELFGGQEVRLWIGWYPQPVPIGLPRGGQLAELGEPVRLSLCPGAPWLLGFAVAAAASVTDQLAPARPVVAGLPGPVTRPGRVRLDFRAAVPGAVPLLSALPSLRRQP